MDTDKGQLNCAFWIFDPAPVGTRLMSDMTDRLLQIALNEHCEDQTYEMKHVIQKFHAHLQQM